MIDVELSYVGTITLSNIGEFRGTVEYPSDGKSPFFASIPIINGNPQISIGVASGTVINDMMFKSSAI